MTNKPDDGAAKDYTGQGTGGEEITVIDSDEKLDAYLKGGGAAAQGGLQTEEERLAAEAAAKTPPTATQKKPKATSPADPNFKLPETVDEGDGEEQEEEYTNMVDYLNREFDLGLAVDALPKDMTQEQQAEAVGEIFRRINDGVRGQLGEYQAIDNLLKDKEVAMFLQAKREGKTLKDIATQYSASPAAAPDDVIVSRHLKVMFPTLTDAEIQEQVADHRTKNRLDKMATAARDYFKAEDAKEAERVTKLKAEAELQEEQQFTESVQSFGRFLQSTNQVYNIPITPEMKKKMFAFVTARDSEGITQHDRALQSEAGTFMSAFAHLFLGPTLKGRATTRSNKANKSVLDRLFESPEGLQSGSEAKEQGEFNPALANQF